MGDHDKSLCRLVLEAENVFVLVPAECLYHTNVSSLNSTVELPERTGINDHLINLVNAKEPLYALLSHPLPLRTLFICKIDVNLRLCIRGFNYLTMKKQYPLFLIKALSAWLKCQFRLKVRFLGYMIFSYIALIFRCLFDFYRRFIPGFSRIAAPLTSMLKTTGSSGLSAPKMFRLRTMRFLGVMLELMKRLWTCLSHQKVEVSSKVEKPQRLKKLQKSSVWKNIYRNTNLLSIRYKELELPLKLWQFFKLFCLAQELFWFHIRSDYHQNKSSWAIDTLSRFSLEEQGKSLSWKHSSLLLIVTNGLSAPKSLSATHILFLLFQFWKCAPEENVLV